MTRCVRTRRSWHAAGAQSKVRDVRALSLSNYARHQVLSLHPPPRYGAAERAHAAAAARTDGPVLGVWSQVAYGQVFYLLHMAAPAELHSRLLLRSGSSEAADELHTPIPDKELSDLGAFDTAAEAMLSVFRMMIGDFEREWFDTPVELFLFLSYTFLVMVMMLNVLIAVVSDSYVTAIELRPLTQQLNPVFESRLAATTLPLSSPSSSSVARDSSSPPVSAQWPNPGVACRR
jgi:hypothetical protein